MESQQSDIMNPWSVISSHTAFDCPYFQIRQDVVSLAGGAARSYSSVRMKYYGVCALPIDEKGRVTLVGQYRYVLDRFTWEVPGGGAAIGTDPLVTARAELKEETGCRAEHWLKLMEGMVSPGVSSEIVPAYVAWGLVHAQPADDPQEPLSRRWVPFHRAVDMALGGEIANLAGVAALLALDVRLRRGNLPQALARLLRKA